MASSLQVLVVESEPGAADGAVEELRNAGHEVVRCREGDGPAFPCRGVGEPGACPVETHPLDLALTVRADARMQPTATEDGVSCALRHRIPVVVAGSVVLNPYEEYATAVVNGEAGVVETCERVVAMPLAEHSARAEKMLSASLDRHEITGDRSASVHRSKGGLIVTLHMPAATPSYVRNLTSVRVLDAMRAFDPTASGIEIVVAV